MNRKRKHKAGDYVRLKKGKKSKQGANLVGARFPQFRHYSWVHSQIACVYAITTCSHHRECIAG